MAININQSIFGTYDIRGKYPKEINEKLFQGLAFWIVQILRRQNGSRLKVKVVVACDGRLSSPDLYRAMITGLEKCETAGLKIEIIKLGLATTPMFYFSVHRLKADGGVVITASHLPKNYNGLKIVGRKAMPISGREILKFSQDNKS